MKHLIEKRRSFRACALAMLCAGAGYFTFPAVPDAQARPSDTSPALVISGDPLPADLRSKIYSKPSMAPQTTPQQVLGDGYYNNGGAEETVVGRKVSGLRRELFALQGQVATLSERLATLETNGQNQAATYYASIATISTQLQSGTTPGNPRLIEKLDIARDNLEWLSGNITALNALAMEISKGASSSTYLLETVRATYGLGGAIEEDHVRLAQLEDAINSTVVIVERLLNNVNDDITRTTAYLATERENLRTLSLAINTGDMFGKSLSNRPFSSASQANFTPNPAAAYDGAAPGASPASFSPPAAPSAPRPLVKIRFDRPDVAYQQPLYMAVNEALARYPSARFELVAVHPSAGNAAQVAIESTRARRNGERVLRSMTEMGLSLDNIDVSYMPSETATTNEVHLYIR